MNYYMLNCIYIMFNINIFHNAHQIETLIVTQTTFCNITSVHEKLMNALIAREYQVSENKKSIVICRK